MKCKNCEIKLNEEIYYKDKSFYSYGKLYGICLNCFDEKQKNYWQSFFSSTATTNLKWSLNYFNFKSEQDKITVESDPAQRIYLKNPKGIKELEINNCLVLEEIKIKNAEEIQKTTIRNCPELKEIESEISGELKIENCANLEFVDFDYSKLQTFSIANCPAVKAILLNHNKLKQINFDSLPQLINLEVEFNDFEELPASQFPKLMSLKYKGNSKLGVLDLTSLKDLRSVSFSRPPLLDNNEKLQQKISELQTKITQLESQILPFLDNSEDNLNSDQIKNLLKINTDQAKDLVDQIVQINQLKEKLEKANQLEQEKTIIIADYRKEKEKILQEYEKEFRKLKKEVQKSLQAIENLKKENETLQTELNNAKLEKEKWEKETQKLKEKLAEIKEELELTQEEKELAEETLKELKELLGQELEPSQLESVLKNSQNAEKTYQELSNQKQQNKQDLKRLKEQIQLLEKANDKIKQLKKKKEKAEQELIKVESKLIANSESPRVKPTTNFFAWWIKHKSTVYMWSGLVFVLLSLGVVYNFIKNEMTK